jgi:hypothetical protein
VFIHGVTSLSALGNIIPAVSESATRMALRFAWQAGCALYACYGAGTAVAEEIEIAHHEERRRILADRAVAHGDEHVIKFTEACLRRNALSPSPTYVSAVHSALSLLPPR